MPVREGRHTVGPGDGSLVIRTYREGVAQKVGHDLVIDVAQWHAAVEVSGDGRLSAVELEADPRSLQIRDGVGGVKPLTDRDRAEIRKNIDEKVLRAQPIAFSSTAVEDHGEAVTVNGELALGGTHRPTSFEVRTTADGRATATVTVTQSEWGIKPYRGLMGALRVRDTVEIDIDVALPQD
jgi:polyisoprenoid-binding protein YceI